MSDTTITTDAPVPAFQIVPLGKQPVLAIEVAAEITDVKTAIASLEDAVKHIQEIRDNLPKVKDVTVDEVWSLLDFFAGHASAAITRLK